MTDYYIASSGGNNSQTGNGISNPYDTVAGVQAAVTLTPSDRLIFRAGTYTTQLAYGGDANHLMEIDSEAERPGTIMAESGETVIFEVPNGSSHAQLLSFHSVDPASANSTYTIKDIHFRMGSGTVTDSLLKMDSKSSVTHRPTFIVDGCTFTQTASETDNVDGGFESTTGSTNGRNIEIKNCTFNIADKRIMKISSVGGTGSAGSSINIHDNVFNLNSPSTSGEDNTSESITLGASTNNTGSNLIFQNNQVNWNHNTGFSSDSTCIFSKIEYFKKVSIINNYYKIVSADTDGNGKLCFMRPALSDATNRTLEELNICGNTFETNHHKGDSIIFYASGSPLVGNVNIIDNHFIGNELIRNQSAHECINTAGCRVNTINVKRNIAEGYQDFIKFDNMDTLGSATIEENICQLMGNADAGVTSTTAISINIFENDALVIKNNTFFIDQQGSSIIFNSGQANNNVLQGNHFVALNPDTSGAGDFSFYRVAVGELNQVTIDDNYYYGFEKLDSDLFLHSTSGSGVDPCSVANADVTFKTTDMVKQGLVRPVGMVKRMTKNIAWSP